MRKVILSTFVFAACILPFTRPAPASESSGYTRIIKLFKTGKKAELREEARGFFRKHPESKNIPDIRLMLAEIEENPEKAGALYRVLLEKYRYYPRRDYAHLRICEILYLRSRWEEVVTESREAEKLFPKSAHLTELRLLRAASLMHLNRYEEARDTCLETVRTDHNYHNLAAANLMLAHIENLITGNSRTYLGRLNELIMGFEKSESAPTALYLLGKYYEQKGEYNRAYSAFADVMKKYPRSPEASFSGRRIESLKQHNPTRTTYLPDREYINRLDSIDIKPEIKIGEGTPENNGAVYSVSLGPFENRRHALAVGKLIEKDFSPLELIQVAGAYRLFVGRAADQERALTIKVRLAEEFGINGSIVRVTGDREKIFIYGE